MNTSSRLYLADLNVQEFESTSYRKASDYWRSLPLLGVPTKATFI